MIGDRGVRSWSFGPQGATHKTITINARTIAAFLAGVAVTAIILITFRAVTGSAAVDDEATLVPISPCRLIDTRPGPRVGPHAAFGTADTKTIATHGSNGNCTIPTDAVGLSLDVTAIRATQPTFVTIWPDGARPVASSLNPTPGQPPTPNAVSTILGTDGAFRIYNLQGTVEVIVDVNGYYTNDGLSALQSRITELEAKTAAMTTETVDGQPTVRFSGVNVQIVDGTGNTAGPVNGRGNLIVGYHENSASQARTGSHNLIAGIDHGYTSYGGVVAGEANAISGPTQPSPAGASTSPAAPGRRSAAGTATRRAV